MITIDGIMSQYDHNNNPISILGTRWFAPASRVNSSPLYGLQVPKIALEFYLVAKIVLYACTNKKLGFYLVAKIVWFACVAKNGTFI